MNTKGYAHIVAAATIGVIAALMVVVAVYWDANREETKNTATTTGITNAATGFSTIVSTDKLSTPGFFSDNIPQELIDAMDAYIIERTGRAFYDDHIELHGIRFYDDPQPCPEHLEHCQQPFYHTTYRFVRPDSNLGVGITINISTEGVIYASEYGVPYCIENELNCSFPLTDIEQVESVALDYGFQKGIKGWEIRYPPASTEYGYTITVTNTLEEEGLQSSGKTLTIDANNGDVLEDEEWENIIRVQPN